MTSFANKVARGLPTDAEDWNQHLIDAHQVAPGMTPSAYANYHTKDGLSSYQILANTVPLQSTVLDLACGDGYLIPHLLARATRVVGVDMSEEELNIARHIHGQNPRVELHLARAQKLPLADASVDAIVCHMAFMLMDPLDPVVLEIARVLKPGGSFAMILEDADERKGLMRDIQQLTYSFILARYPQIANARSGDDRIDRKEFSTIFPSQLFKPEIQVSKIPIFKSIRPEEAWSIKKNTYFVGVLNPQEKEELKTQLITFALGHKPLELEVPMQMIRVTRQLY